MEKSLSRLEYASLLYDFYGVLLSDAQREVMALYHEDNLSLSEIAEELQQSRQAVHYTLKKAEAALAGYEEKLGLIASYERNQQLASEAINIIANSDIDAGNAAKLTDIIIKLSE